jgi:hypothetical protein
MPKRKIQLTPRQLLSAFRQKGFDCVAIAIIKAAIDRYGVFGVFRKYEEDDEGLKAVLRSGEKIQLSWKQFSRFRKKISLKFKSHARLKRKQEPYNLSFRGMVQRYYVVFAYLAKEDDVDVFNGANADYAHAYLGIKRTRIQKMKQSKLSQIQGKGLVIYNNYHAMAASKGLYDDYGSPRKLTIPAYANDHRVKWWYRIK